MPNRMVACVLQEADVALRQSRAAGGTNLIAMESMACDTQTILSINTGPLDPIGEGRSVPPTKQKPVRGRSYRG